jgi:hypothetical protein
LSSNLNGVFELTTNPTISARPAASFVRTIGCAAVIAAALLTGAAYAAEPDVDNADLPVRCTSPLDKGYSCSDGSKATPDGGAVLEGRKLASHPSDVGTTILTITSSVIIPECKTAGDYTWCTDQPLTDTDFVTASSKDKCRELGPILTFKKWTALQKDRRQVLIEWSCD